MTEQTLDEQIVRFMASIDSRLEAIEARSRFRQSEQDDLRRHRSDLNLEVSNNQRTQRTVRADRFA